MSKSLWTGLAVAALAIPAIAAPLASGLKPGASVTPFHPKHLAGPLAGTSNCFPCTFQNRPQVQVWVNGDDTKNVTAIVKSLSTEMKEHEGKEFKALVVFLTDKKNEEATELTIRRTTKVAGTEGVGMAMLPKDSEYVQDYAINTGSDVKNTVLVYKDWKVQKNLVNLKADEAGLKMLDTAIDTIAK